MQRRPKKEKERQLARKNGDIRSSAEEEEEALGLYSSGGPSEGKAGRRNVALLYAHDRKRKKREEEEGEGKDSNASEKECCRFVIKAEATTTVYLPSAQLRIITHSSL